MPVLCVAADINTFSQRAIVINRARELVASAPGAKSVPDNTASPYMVASAAERTPASKKSEIKSPASDRELLQLLSAKFVPSGTANLGGEPLLLLGQKKIKIGDRVPIILDSATYEVEVTAIGRTSFTLRYKDETLSKNIQPVKTP